MPTNLSGRSWVGVAALAVAGGLVWLGLSIDPATDPAPRADDPHGELEADVTSKFSRIKVRKFQNVRTLYFVRDTGEEVVESMLNLDKPHDLIVDYTRYMFLSYVFKPKQERVLIVGLGGGSMIHFMKHYDPNAKVDVVEIDPKVVEIAEKYFGVKTAGNVNIITRDAFEFFKAGTEKYDVIYIDAFLKPAKDTDTTGVPLRLKTIQFYKDMQKKLSPDGMVVFNINPHEKIDDDVKNITEAFPQMYAFHLPNFGGLAVVGSMNKERLSAAAVRDRAAELDRRFKTSYSYREMAGNLAK
jgi:spermidine synthase